MRTTLTIADDVLHAARERARREGRPVGDVLSDLARAGLNARGAAPSEPATGQDLYGFVPFPRRGPAVSNELIDLLLDDDPA
ncbi:MAG: CopG family transcriptional regulator [Acidimicrobiales bacterium]